jgi:hypothetical protein
MSKSVFPAPGVLVLALTLTSACNGEPFRFPPHASDAGGTGTPTNTPTGSTGGGIIDSGTFDSSVVATPDAGAGDASAVDAGDGSVGTGISDGGGGVTDAAADAAPRDAGGDGAIPCDVNDRRFGCDACRSQSADR